MLQQRLSSTRNTWSGETRVNSGQRAEKATDDPFPLKPAWCWWDSCPDVCSQLVWGCACSARLAQSTGTRGSATPELPGHGCHPHSHCAVAPEPWPKALQADPSASEPKTLTEGSSNSPAHLLHTLQCCCFLLFLFMNKFISKSTVIKDINSIITKAYLVFFSPSKMEKNLHITVSLLNFHSLNAAKFSKTQNVYLVCHIKL